MKKFAAIFAAFLIALTLGSCGGGDSSTSGVDPAVEVVAFREAVPDSMTLSQVLVPGAGNGRQVAVIGGAALYPPFVVPVATQINDMVGLVVADLFTALDDLAVGGIEALFDDPTAARVAPLNFTADF